MPATDPRNPLVLLRHERLCHKSNWRRRHGIPDSPEATLRLWPCTPTAEATPAHCALRLAVDTRAGYRLDNRPEWKRRRGRPCRAWMQQIEDDSGLNVNDAWRIAHDRKSWRALRPVAGQAVQWVSEYGTCMTWHYQIVIELTTSLKLGTGDFRHWSATITRQYGKPLRFWVMTQQKRRRRCFATPADEWSRGVSVVT